ncbi:MAG: AMP-dependent synthetase/ligase [Microbacter sp.]
MKRTIIDLFEEAVGQYGLNTFLFEKKGSGYEETTYLETKDLVYQLGAGLVSLGAQKGEHAALLSESRNLWIIGELAMFYAGLINVPLSVKLDESSDLLFRLQHSEAKYLVVSANQLPKIRAIKSRLTIINYIIVLDELDHYEEKEMPVKELFAAGIDFLRKHSLEDFLAIGQSIQNEDVATITYTSGTTADPKGVMLTHRNYTANVEQSLTLLTIPETWRTLIILPLDHCFAHVVGFFIFMTSGAGVATLQTGKTPMETLKNIPINIKEIKPHMMLSVPSLAKSFRKNIENAVRAKSKFTNILFHWGLKVAYTYHQYGHTTKKPWHKMLYPLNKIFDQLLFSKLRAAFGGNLQFFIGGGALLDIDLQQFFYALGIPMYQGYGLSEATPVISSNGPEHHLLGSSGKLVKPLSLKIMDTNGHALPVNEKGEIVIQGENVMAGYWKNEQASKEVLKDGWLFTGDMGYMDSNGYLYVLGRYKSLLIGNDGEKYSPEGIEEALISNSHHIDQLFLHNNQSPYTVGLIYPNREALKRHIKHDPSTLEGKKEALQLIINDIQKFKKGGVHVDLFPERWLPSVFAILQEPFSEENRMINSTMKIARGEVETVYRETFAYLYTPEGKDNFNERNLNAVFN